jgi:hypothetical protein
MFSPVPPPLTLCYVALPALCLFALQPHGRDESLITGKMWKHILVQGLYQLFWLFFFLYALPLVFPQYQETSYCQMITMGPDENNLAWCATTLQTDLGASAADAQLYCGAMGYCGLPCGAETRQSPQCPLSTYFPPGQVGWMGVWVWWVGGWVGGWLVGEWSNCCAGWCRCVVRGSGGTRGRLWACCWVSTTGHMLWGFWQGTFGCPRTGSDNALCPCLREVLCDPILPPGLSPSSHS